MWWRRSEKKRDVIALRHDQWRLSHARPGDAVPLMEETMKGLDKLLTSLGDPPLQGLTAGVFQQTLFNSPQTYCPYCRRHR